EHPAGGIERQLAPRRAPAVLHPLQTLASRRETEAFQSPDHGGAEVVVHLQGGNVFEGGVGRGGQGPPQPNAGVGPEVLGRVVRANVGTRRQAADEHRRVREVGRPLGGGNDVGGASVAHQAVVKQAQRLSYVWSPEVLLDGEGVLEGRVGVHGRPL